jgi:hypothetical protein
MTIGITTLRLKALGLLSLINIFRMLTTAIISLNIMPLRVMRESIMKLRIMTLNFVKPNQHST